MADLERVWRETAAEHGLDRARAQRLWAVGERGAVHRDTTEDWEARTESALTAKRATFEARELRATVLEQTVGDGAPEQVGSRAAALRESGRILELEGGRMTTGRIREMERAVETRAGELAAAHDVEVSEPARRRAITEVGERVGGPLSAQQRDAVQLLGGPERFAILVGEAGAGKGVVIDAAARAEELSGREPVGVAVAGATAERLGEECPSLAGRTMTLDALVAREHAGSIGLGERSTVIFDEAGMADTQRMDALTDLVAGSGAKLVVVGDERQLPSIGAGGMFERLAEHAPTARLSEVRRTEDPDERRAWADLRAGRAERAMAHYHARGHLHLSDSRDQAVERAVRQWADLTEGVGGLDAREVALMSDASTAEINRLNARAQHLRRERGELGRQEVALPDVAYGLRAGDRVAFTAQHHPAGERRVENGTRGEVVAVNARHQRVTVCTDEAEREVTLADDDLGSLRLAYAQHLYRQQGATVERAVVVTGGWQTSREGAYVEASRARHGTDWHVAREDLGTDGADSAQIERLAERMRASRAQAASLAFDEPQMEPTEPGLERELALSTERALERSIADRLDRGLDRGVDQSLDIDDDFGMGL